MKRNFFLDFYRIIVPAKLRNIIRKIRSLKLILFFHNGIITFKEDSLIAFTNADFLRDHLFVESYALGKGTESWGTEDIRWRAYVACFIASLAKDLPGDFVECGVNKGGLSRMIINYIKFQEFTDKKFYLVDTYNGLVEKYISMEEKNLGIKAGGFEECYENVKQTFSPFKNVEIIRGVVPDTLDQVLTSKVAYLSIDMNCAEPEVAAVEFFWDKLVPGGLILLDDYGDINHIIQKRAMDEFTSRIGIKVFSLPTGQGIIIKPWVKDR